MIQCADDDPVDAGRIMGSPGHGGWMKMAGVKPDLSNYYNAEGGEIAGRAHAGICRDTVFCHNARIIVSVWGIAKWPRSGQGTFS